jgi:general secretion pathway protein G
MRQYGKKQKGFTLIEIMVVVVIIGILIGLVAPNIVGNVDEARVTAAKADISTLVDALERYYMDNSAYPTTDQGLPALVEKPTVSPEPKNWRAQGYIKRKKMLQDPWSNEYRYISPGASGPYDLYSLGSDSQEGGEGVQADIGQWDL